MGNWLMLSVAWPFASRVTVVAREFTYQLTVPVGLAGGFVMAKWATVTVANTLRLKNVELFGAVIVNCVDAGETVTLIGTPLLSLGLLLLSPE